MNLVQVSGTNLTYVYVILGISLAALAIAFALRAQVLAQDEGTAKMQEIAEAVQEGAAAYLSRQFKTLSVFVAIVFVLLFALPGETDIKIGRSIFFLVGAGFSALVGYNGMWLAVRANVRVAEAARKKSAERAVKIAFRTGGVVGMTTVGLGLLGASLVVIIYKENAPAVLEGFGFGAAMLAMFMRVGGGIFTKAADVGADLVGKVEAGIPEDDPRNPAVIADNVGDNVGDCAGMAADLFETYAVTIVATMVLASIFFSGNLNMLIYPLAIAGSCLITSIIGTYFVRLGASKSIMGALYKGFIVSAVLSLAILYPVTEHVIGLTKVYKVGAISFTGLKLYYCGAIGLVITGLLIWVTEYYTSTAYNPVKSIAKSSTTGHGTNVIQGLAVSMEATAIPALIIVVGILSTYLIAGLYGIAISVTTMLALTGMVVALDAYGPVTDNAGGIAQMSNLPPSVRKVTDALDAVGNTTKAITKGYAIGSAGLGALVLFAAYTEDIKHFAKTPGSALKGIVVNFDLSNPYVVIGLLIGGLLPYLFASMGMQAVGRAGGAVVVEVRRQFKKWPGIMKNKQKPDYKNAVDILTKAAIKEMIVPSLLPVLSPIVLYVIIYYIAGTSSALSALGAMLLGVIITGFFLAVSMTAGGGAWDNAKKYIEDGHYGGKGSDAHKAAVTGDTVGDPYKDTAGPAVNPMIKITNIVALLLLAIIAR